MTINKEKGLVFTNKDGISLPLENLSSGEQHELVLFYDLLFRVTPGSLILIDEPELSLHVVWQEQFLKDIQQVTTLANIDVIIATHSPDIISDRRDLVVELEGPEGDYSG
jgi:predicted ATP-binding protein involved in virulence